MDFWLADWIVRSRCWLHVYMRRIVSRRGGCSGLASVFGRPWSDVARIYDQQMVQCANAYAGIGHEKCAVCFWPVLAHCVALSVAGVSRTG